MELEQLVPERDPVEAEYGNNEYDNGDANDVAHIDSISKRFQWLPAELKVAQDGTTCHFDSYINNLHPQHHEPLYRTLEKCFASMIPLFEEVLTDLRDGNGPRYGAEIGDINQFQSQFLSCATFVLVSLLLGVCLSLTTLSQNFRILRVAGASQQGQR